MHSSQQLRTKSVTVLREFEEIFVFLAVLVDSVGCLLVAHFEAIGEHLVLNDIIRHGVMQSSQLTLLSITLTMKNLFLH